MGLLDVLQSASNAVAGNVAGPVDLLSFALRKAGIPIPEDALGGSEWMKRKGLMRDVPHGAEQVVGETLGLLAPTAIAANAPKIARGLLHAQENAAAPRMLHPETGAIVWHGSPHKFDRFDSSKMGTGEGAQAYGAGSYLAEAKGVGEGYAKNLASTKQNVVNNAIQRVVHLNNRDASRVRDALVVEGFPREAITPELEKTLRKIVAGTADDGTVQSAVLKEYDHLKRLVPSEGYLYKADIPDEWLPKMLDWDKPLSQQGGVEAFAKLPNFARPLDAMEASNVEGQRLYQRLSNKLGDADASKALKEAGIPGIRYLDAASRPSSNIIDQRLLGLLQKHDNNAEAAVDAFMRSVHNTPKQKAAMRSDLLQQLSVKPTSNFVIFPGLEDQIKILERNGVPLGLLTP